MKKIQMSTIMAAGLIAISLLFTAPLTFAATDNPAEQPDASIVESDHGNLDHPGLPAATPQPKDSATERYRHVLEQLRLPAVDEQSDESNLHQDPQ